MTVHNGREMADDPHNDFIKAACVPRDQIHSAGTLDGANAILIAHPDVATRSIHAAAILGDDATVRSFLAADAASATVKGGPYGWDALTHLCFSRYLRLDRSRSTGFVATATALLDAGASANTGWFEADHQPKPEWEGALYGASGIAHHAELTRLLLERGADPNDGETVYHSPESYDNTALKLLVESGKLTGESLSLMLIRKHDWHDYDGVKWLLEHGADPNFPRQRGFKALNHAIARDNRLTIIELLLDHDADPTAVFDGRSAIALAARRGRGDILELLERRGLPVTLQGTDRLIAACARNDAAGVRAIVETEPALVRDVIADGGELLAQFAGNGNTSGVDCLLDLGVPVAARSEHGDGYFGIAKNSTALHAAGWRAQHATVRLLIARGAPIDALDGSGRSALALAVQACVDSYWSERRSPDSVSALLHAGASVNGVRFPSGYDAVDELIRSRMPG